ncbi:MAG: thiamine phosphate synthase [Pseudomonadota bacterium]
MPPPRLLSISPPDPDGAAAWVALAPSLVAAGADGLLLRVPGVSGLPLEAWVAGLAATGAAVLLHARTPGGLALALARGLGLHLPAGAGAVPGSALLGQSCHGLAELRTAAACCAYATLSPIYAPMSKPDDARPVLGPRVLARACAAVDLPVLALGGIGVAQARACIAAGAWGFAGIGALSTPERVAALASGLAAGRS